MENYWQKKIEDERNFYEDQLKSSERTFHELEERIQDYEELLAAESSKTSEARLYTIEEDEQLEIQVNLWEAEIEALNGQIEELNRHQEDLVKDWSDRIRSIEEEKNHLERKCYKLLTFINEGNVRSYPRITESGPQSLPYQSNVDQNYEHQHLFSM